MDDAQVVEGDDGYVDLVFRLSLSAPTGRTVTASYATSDGTATAPADYQPTGGHVTFNQRETAKTVRVPVFGDTVYEGDETLRITVSNVAGAVLADGDGTGTIVENDPDTQRLQVSLAGDGVGSVSSSPAGIECGSDCTHDYASGTAVTLTATPEGASTFTGWSGDCTGTGACTVTMDAPRAVTATFAAPPPAPQDLTVAVTGQQRPDPAFGGTTAQHATGDVTSSPAGIDCAYGMSPLGEPQQSGDCAESVPSGTVVTLTAAPGPVYGFTGTGYQPTGETSAFAGWGGACTGTDPVCVVTVDQARNVTANFGFAPPDPTLTVSVVGERRSVGFGPSDYASGRVTSNPAGIDCANGVDALGNPTQTGACTDTVPSGTLVTLTATPGPVYVFTGTGWAPSQQTSAFAGWSGACSGSDRVCTITVDQARNVTATFAFPPPNQTLTVSITGAQRGGSFLTQPSYATGSVTSNPAGIDCRMAITLQASDCSESVPSGTVVTLTATPGPVYSPDTLLLVHQPTSETSVFTGWSGACSGTNPVCTVTVDQARNVTATFGFQS